MGRLALSGLIALAALAASANMSGGAMTEAATPPMTPLAHAVSHIEGVPSEALPESGRCRIWFNDIPTAKQPAAMECEHATWIAHSWGGRVIAVNGLDAEVVAQFDGRDDFSGVPAQALPPRGYCRAWIADRPLEAQPQASDCVVARRIAAANDGRVLFMPL